MNSPGFWFFNKEDETMSAKYMLQITLILAVLAACFAIPRSASADGPCGSTYVVQPGDWLAKIADRCGVTLAALYAANPWASYYLYIYPGQVLNIPGGPGPGNPVPGPGYPGPGPGYPGPGYYGPPPNCGLAVCQPYRAPGIVYSSYYFPSISVAPYVGDKYYGTTAQVGATLTFLVRVKNNGNTALQVVANLSLPSNLELGEDHNDCPDSLAVGSACTFSWRLTPLASGQTYVRVYVRGLYGNTERVTQSPAYFFDVK
jgi:uncharacterized repeat protein (TIGR01451 family)